MLLFDPRSVVPSSRPPNRPGLSKHQNASPCASPDGNIPQRESTLTSCFARKSLLKELDMSLRLRPEGAAKCALRDLRRSEARPGTCQLFRDCFAIITATAPVGIRLCVPSKSKRLLSVVSAVHYTAPHCVVSHVVVPLADLRRYIGFRPGALARCGYAGSAGLVIESGYPFVSPSSLNASIRVTADRNQAKAFAWSGGVG